MSSERLARYFHDAIRAVDLIETWARDAGGARAAVFHDMKVRSAIERQFLILSEAAVRMDKLDSTRAAELTPTIDWAGIRGMGNFIRHKYDDLDTTIIVEVVENRLGELRRACARAIEILENGEGL